MITSIVAEAYGLPFLPAYLNISKDQDNRKGVNFTFAGATALDVKYYEQNGIDKPDTNNSLSIQVGWFTNLKPSICKSLEGFFFNHNLLNNFFMKLIY